MNPITPTTPGGRNGSNIPFGQGQSQNQIKLSPASASQRGTKRALESDGEDENEDGTPNTSRGLKQPAIKRACNECRQQKLRCDVQQDPSFVACSRCQKHKLTCLIEPNFKRVGKRSRHAEMEREIQELRARVRQLSGGQGMQNISAASTPYISGSAPPNDTTYNGDFANDDEQFLGPHQAVASLLDLRGGSPSGVKLMSLGEVLYAPDKVAEFFNIFFENYHPYLPFLDRDRPPEQYLKDSRLLFWTIIAVAARKHDPNQYVKIVVPLTSLLWKTITACPQDHHTVKALCLHLTWPLPTDKTSTDNTFMLCGLMIQLAMQIGLHQPAHAEDFSRFRIQLQNEDINDRVRTWAVCNIVAQAVSTGYGQPPITIYDSTLTFAGSPTDHSNVVSPQLYARLKLEMAADRISRYIYGNHHANESGTSFFDRKNPRRPSFGNIEVQRINDETNGLKSHFTDIEWLYQKATVLHLRLYSFFDTSSTTLMRTDLLELYHAATAFLDDALALDASNRLHHAPNLIFQMILAAGFALLKLLNSEYAAQNISVEGRKYFSNAVRMARSFSTKTNDLPMRLCEVLAQLWKESGSGAISNPSKSNLNSPMATAHTPFARQGSLDSSDDAVRLKVRSRMSMSVVFDSVWRWRETHTSDRLESAVQNPTNPDSSSNSTPPPGAVNSFDPGLDTKISLDASSLAGFAGVSNAGASSNALSMPLGMANGMVASGTANSYEFFDPMSWMLDFDPPGWNNHGGGFGGGFSDFTN